MENIKISDLQAILNYAKENDFDEDDIINVGEIKNILDL